MVSNFIYVLISVSTFCLCKFLLGGFGHPDNTERLLKAQQVNSPVWPSSSNLSFCGFLMADLPFSDHKTEQYMLFVYPFVYLFIQQVLRTSYVRHELHNTIYSFRTFIEHYSVLLTPINSIKISLFFKPLNLPLPFKTLLCISLSRFSHQN